VTFSAPDFDDHERLIHWCDPDSGLRAIVAIHRVRHGRALGGCRVRDYGSEQDALADVLRLSRGMSLKAALAGLPCGGAKAVISGAPETVKTEAALRSSGRLVDSQGGVYVTAEDVGMSQADIEVVKRETPWALGASEAIGESSPYTARGVFHALRGALRHVRGDERVAGLTVAVQGAAGKVGAYLCDLLHDAGARLVVADIDEAGVQRVAARTGARAVDPDAIHAAEADVFAPCALGGTLNARTIPELRARIVVGAANNQLATPEDGTRLHERGIAYVADYLASAGGITSGVAELDDAGPDGLDGRLRQIADTAILVLEEAQRRAIPASAAADMVAAERLDAP
jgi:leucine dehydrogenase